MSLNFDIWKALVEMSLNDSLDFLKTFPISNDQLKCNNYFKMLNLFLLHPF